MKKGLVLFIALLFIFSGCAPAYRKNTRASQSYIEPSLLRKFPDIPVPSGFKPEAENSYAFMNSAIRVGLLKYAGKGEVDSVINFYKEQMPLYNWGLLNIIEYGISVLSFEKDAEVCSVNIEQAGRRCRIAIAVNPKSSQSIKTRAGGDDKEEPPKIQKTQKSP